MTEIKLDPKVRADVAKALADWASRMFDDQTGQWTAVVTFGHRARSEEVKTDDDFDYLERTVKLCLLDAEVVTGPHKQAAEKAARDARTERETAGTLLEGAFDDQH